MFVLPKIRNLRELACCYDVKPHKVKEGGECKSIDQSYVE